ncbi:MAG: hypothetical protein KGZ97_00865 [Bacteroidetes bacterium]|nr:hypothetical protein [Bacteroidota bacterium]
MIKRILLLAIFSVIITEAYTQPDMNYWNRVRYFKITGGTVTPCPEFSDATENGLFAKDGYQFGFDYNYMIAYGFGLGLNLEFNRFHFNKEAFASFAQPDYMAVIGGYSSSKFGLNALFNLPIVVSPDIFTINLYAEGNAGIRSISIPSIDLEYNEIVNYYTEVKYRSRPSSMGYLGYSGGIQFIFKNKFGINASYSALNRRINRINYSVRMFDAQGELYEEERYISNYLDHTGLQFGIFFMFGKK